MKRGRPALLCAAALVSACSGTPFRGGYASPDAPIARSRRLLEFVPGHCDNSAHEPELPRVSSVEVIETSTGRTLLVEHREGHEMLVAENHFDDGSFWVFQVVVKADDLVREWRLPRSAGATGTFVSGRELGESDRGNGFQAGLASVHLACSLVPKRSDLPRGSTNRVR